MIKNISNLGDAAIYCDFGKDVNEKINFKVISYFNHLKKLVKELKKTQVPLTVCPLSNVKLCVFDKLEDHNIKKMLNQGLRVMINSDDPAYFGGYLNKNLIETQSALNLSIEEIKTLIINSFKSSFLDETKKNEWIKKIN